MKLFTKSLPAIHSIALIKLTCYTKILIKKKIPLFNLNLFITLPVPFKSHCLCVINIIQLQLIINEYCSIIRIYHAVNQC